MPNFIAPAKAGKRKTLRNRRTAWSVRGDLPRAGMLTLAVLGFLVVGGGVAVVAPLSFSAAARIAGGDTADPVAHRARVDAVIGRFNQFNYAGALVGSVLTGVVGSGNLRIGFAVPMVLVLLLLPLARAFSGGLPTRSTTGG